VLFRSDISLNIGEDTLDEDDETVRVSLGPVINATPGTVSVYTATILDDDPLPRVRVNISDEFLPESGGATTIAAELSEVSGRTVTLNFNFGGTASGSDYTIPSSSIAIPTGNLEGSLVLQATDDVLDEDAESVVVTVASVVNAAGLDLEPLTATITDDDPTPSLTFGDVLVSEPASGSSNAVFTLLLSAPSGRTITVDVRTVDGTATDRLFRKALFILSPGTISSVPSGFLNTKS